MTDELRGVGRKVADPAIERTPFRGIWRRR